MAKPLVDDELWTVVEPLLPEHKPHPRGGKPPVDDRVCLRGILFVLKTGIAWEDFPCEMGCCGMTLLNRLRQWQKAGRNKGDANLNIENGVRRSLTGNGNQKGEKPKR